MSRLWVVAYDIADHRRRRQVAATLATCCTRVQESVFEGWLTPPRMRHLLDELTRLIQPQHDSVRFYPLLSGEPPRTDRQGPGPHAARAPEFWLI